MSDSTQKVINSLKKRHRKEKVFRAAGATAIGFGFLLVFLLITDIITKATPAFKQNWIAIEVDFQPDLLGIDGLDLTRLPKGDYRTVLRSAIFEMMPEVSGRRDKRSLFGLISSSAEFEIRNHLVANPADLGKKVTVWVKVDDDVDSYLKDDVVVGEPGIRISEKQATWIKKWVDSELIESRWNSEFFSLGDSREPESAGVKGALTGTFYTMLVTLVLSFPLGVAAALYLEEFAPKNRWTDFIEVNINNLAAVPSIVFGLLGLAVIINIFGLPRSTPLVGGIVLTLMTLPTIIIASRASIKAVPPSIREAAMGLGASRMQVAFSHVLPLAMPGIITGTIIGMAQALGETAPLLMIGMVAFIVDVPGGITDPATVMPVQIYLWADSPERAFVAKTSAAILVLLGFLLIMNSFAAFMRKKFEKRW
ncbi:phosphate ABC transporter permease PstA [Aliikangiella marina]|uniref:Phosphate transport system permease protein PstA n=1 Tax=Aliikangiella marina TaxID=1712262 RepID=A0A545TBL7_9GAMM|nr:phosphate ABC transporter permease PstA [Aliikangiella marina]TQV74618.1 phosphate ABC transporter permease PstA [Aliikangiella marina]